MDQRALPGLIAGLSGCAFSIIGGLLALPVLTVLGAVCALVAGGCSLSLLERARRAERVTSIAVSELAMLREVELSHPANGRSVLDQETGIPDGRFFEIALDSRVSAARRHLWPVAVVILDVSMAEEQRAQHLATFTLLVQGTLREADVACRLGTSTFALVLEDTNEAGGVWAAERLQASVAKASLGIDRLSAGVSSYPTHGLDAGDLLDRARTALDRACSAEHSHGLGQVEVAASVDVI